MADNQTPEIRKQNMSHIRSTNTKPEEMLRHELFQRGYRYRKNDKRLPGKPDIVLPKYRTVIFVNGCFWHMHTECGKFHWPSTNEQYWRKKIIGNVERDKLVINAIAEMGWKIIIVWECELKKKNIEEMVNKLEKQIHD